MLSLTRQASKVVAALHPATIRSLPASLSLSLSAPFSTAEEGEKEVSPKIAELVEQISSLSLLEVVDLNNALKKKLGLEDMPMGMAMGGGGGGAAAPAAEAAAPVAEKTDFALKLDGFDAAKKIKLIKELRAIIPGLGLKEAKELVESAPKTLKEGVKKEEAEELKKKLEEVGAKIVLE